MDLTPDQEARVEKMLPLLRKRIAAAPNISISAITHSVVNDMLQFYVNITSDSLFPKETVTDIENEIDTRFGEKIKLYVMTMPPQVTSSTGYELYEDLSRRVNKKLKAKLKKIWRR